MALKAAGADAATSVFCDDSTRNVKAARAAGIFSVLVRCIAETTHLLVRSRGAADSDAPAADCCGMWKALRQLIPVYYTGFVMLARRWVACTCRVWRAGCVAYLRRDNRSVAQVGRCGADCGADLEVPNLAALRQALPGLWQRPSCSSSIHLPPGTSTPATARGVPPVAMGQGVQEELLEGPASGQLLKESRSQEITVAAGNYGDVVCQEPPAMQGTRLSRACCGHIVGVQLGAR